MPAGKFHDCALPAMTLPRTTAPGNHVAIVASPAELLAPMIP